MFANHDRFDASPFPFLRMFSAMPLHKAMLPYLPCHTPAVLDSAEMLQCSISHDKSSRRAYRWVVKDRRGQEWDGKSSPDHN